MRASMRADGLSVWDVPVVTTDLGGMERTEGGSHRVEVPVCVETTVVMATRGLLGSPPPPEWHIISE